MSETALPLDRQATLLAYASTNKLTTIGVVLSVLLIVIALVAPFIVPHDPLDQNFLVAGQGPSAGPGSVPTRSAATCSPACYSVRVYRFRSASWLQRLPRSPACGRAFSLDISAAGPIGYYHASPTC